MRIHVALIAVLLSVLCATAALAQQRAVTVAPRAPAQAAEQRIALVIGNAAYETGPLRNPVNDARAMAAALTEQGFQVTALENARQSQMKQAIDEFGENLRNAGREAVGLFYYSGHGMQVKGRNWLIPVGAQIKRERQVEYESVDAGRALGAMEDAGNALNIVILDACRDNPFARSFRSAGAGLATVDAASGTFIAYATAPGRTADDGTGSNGLYTEQLIRHMKTPGLKVEDVFKQVRNDVERLSGKKQVPWESSSLKGDFFFAGRPQPVVAAVAVAPPAAPARTLDEEEVLWKAIENSASPQDFEAYLKQFPQGRFVAAARIRARQLADRPAAAAPATKAALSVSTTPPGAQVFLNDGYSGKTPVNLEALEAGKYTVELRLPGYRLWKQEVQVREGQRLEFNETLQVFKGASLDATKWNDSVEIFLNGSLRGKGGQLIEGLEPGTYEIEARKPHSRPWKDRITLVEGAVLPMEAKFEGYRLAIFPGRMTGRYVSKLSQGQKNSQWILTGVGNGGGATFYAGALKTAFSYYPYPNFGVKESPLEELENGTWKGIVFVELDEQFLFRKGRELDVDAVLTFEVDISDNSGPVRAYLADLLTNRVYRYKGDWKSGRLSTDVATGVRDVISQFRKNH